MSLPPPPSREKLPVVNGYAEMPRAWIKWLTDLANQAVDAAAAAVSWDSLSKTGSNITDIETRFHEDLQELDTADHAHLYLSDRDELVGRAVTALHDHETIHIDYPAAYDVGTSDHITTLQELIDHTWSAGITHDCLLTDNGDGTIGLSTGNAILRADTDPHSILYNVYVNAQTPLSLTDDSVNYVYLDWNAGVPIFVASTSQAAFNGMDKCIAWVVHRKGTVLHYIDARNINVDNARKAAHLFLDFTRFIHAEGGTSISSPSALTISVTAGHFYFMLNEIEHDAFDTSVAGTANVNVFTLWYRDGATGWTETINQKTVDTTTYDGNTGTPVTLNNNKYGITWFYIINDAPSELHAVMGQAEYANFETARVASPPSSIPSIVSALGVLIGFVVYEKGVATYDNVYSAFTQMFNPVTATNHNGLAGLQGGTLNEYYHFSSANYTDLTDAGDSALHYHATDRDLANATGTLAIANGGTGQTTATAAFDALAPTTTQGDIIYHNGTDNVRLAKGTAGQVLVMNAGATAPEWQNKLIGYTVATLPAGTVGDRAYVTDATSPTYLGALTGGGAVVCPVFRNATVWVSA